MPLYYNKSAGSLAVTLKSGRTASLPGKTWSTISVEDEGSEDLVRVLGKGFLQRFDNEQIEKTPEKVQEAPSDAPKVDAPKGDASSQKEAHSKETSEPSKAETPKAAGPGLVPLPFKPETPSVPPVAPSENNDEADKALDNSRRRKV
jgi:hypothetical protein